MRFIDVHIANYRSMSDVTVPLDGLTVLTDSDPRRVAEAYDAVLRVLTGRDDNPGNLAGPRFRHYGGEPGTLRIGIEGRHITGSVDEAIAQDAVRKYANELCDELVNVPATALELRRAQVVGLLVERTRPGDDTDKFKFARALINQSTTVVCDLETSLEVTLDALDDAAVAAARSLAVYGCEDPTDEFGRIVFNSDDGFDDYLVRVAGHLIDTGSFKIPFADTGVVHEVCPFEFVDLNLSVETLFADLREAITEIGHSIGYESGSSNLPCQWFHFSQERDPWLIKINSKGEQLDSSANSDRPDPAALKTWFTVEPLVIDAAALIGEHATRLAPSFIRDNGTIRISLYDPTMWVYAPDRFAIEYERNDGTVRRLDQLDAGTARYIAAALRLAVCDLDPIAGVMSDGMDWCSGEIDDLAVTLGLEEADLGMGLPLRISPAARFVTIADPEAHLTAEMARSVGEWLGVLARSHLGVLVTTFSDQILDTFDAYAHIPDLSAQR